MDTTMGSTMNIEAARSSEPVAYTHQLYTNTKEKSRPGRQELTQARHGNSELKTFRARYRGAGGGGK
jgi:hypothetical protein